MEMSLDVESAWLLEDGLAVASWMAPSAAARFDQWERPTRAAIAPYTDDDGQRCGKFWDWLAGHLPTEPCWFLDLVAVHPTARGRRLGSTLVEHGLALAKADGLPAFLETSQLCHVSFYEQFGFAVVSEEP